MKTFGIYCSGEASRVIKFYSFKDNLQKYRPEFVIYDGNKEESAVQLNNMFKDCFKYIEMHALSDGEKAKINKVTSDIILGNLVNFKAEYLLCFGNRLLKNPLLNDYKNRLINFHPSILPSFPGLYSIDKALKDKVSFLGNSAHYINDGIDTGEIIIQSIMLAEDFENYEDVLELQFPLIKMVLKYIMNYTITEEEITKEVISRKKFYCIPKTCNNIF